MDFYKGFLGPSCFAVPPVPLPPVYMVQEAQGRCLGTDASSMAVFEPCQPEKTHQRWLFDPHYHFLQQDNETYVGGNWLKLNEANCTGQACCARGFLWMNPLQTQPHVQGFTLVNTTGTVQLRSSVCNDCLSAGMQTAALLGPCNARAANLRLLPLPSDQSGTF